MTTEQTLEAGPATTEVDLDQLSINTIRTLSIDAVEKAQSGHAGAPMALAPVAYTLWNRFLRYDPDQPHWPNRDRFVLSNGHASMLFVLADPSRGRESVRPSRQGAEPSRGQSR